MGAVVGDEARALEKSCTPEEVDDVSEDAPVLEPGRLRLMLFSRWASTRLKLRLSRPC